MVQPSASKRPHLGSSGWDESCAVALDESTGEDLGWPSSDDPSWANLSWPETKDVLQQPLVDVNTAVLLQGETVQGNHGHQASTAPSLENNWWLAALPLQTDDMSKQQLLPQDGVHQLSPSVERLARITARAGGSPSSTGNNFDVADSLHGGDAVGGNVNHQASDAGTLGDMPFHDMTFMTFNDTWLNPLGLQSDDPSKQQPLEANVASSSNASSAVTRSATHRRRRLRRLRRRRPALPAWWETHLPMLCSRSFFASSIHSLAGG
ncbi:unnamed protein product [Zymoseptoria tritici ST99CH_3D7]|uniref:Uncharacterized protein n=1 Tax=Zymoseptoria tritici (strain ST99CH_3D7) TaxID=1276538 RepID=A0A1X7S9S7_ZYMT9|nr:unnamed protein product [Zymoseptoria tritici ST99CH_3D7]